MFRRRLIDAWKPIQNGALNDVKSVLRRKWRYERARVNEKRVYISISVVFPSFLFCTTTNAWGVGASVSQSSPQFDPLK